MVSNEIKIDGKSYISKKIENLKTFLEDSGVKGYGLCHSPAIISSARCELCLVKVNGKIVRACEYFVNDSIEVIGHNGRISFPDIHDSTKILVGNLNKLITRKSNVFNEIVFVFV